MVTIRVGSETVSLNNLQEGWLAEQVSRRAAAGRPVCVRVSIDEDGIGLLLRTPECGNGLGGGRPATLRELAIIELWRERGLNSLGWTAGHLLAFLKQLPRYL